MSRRTLLLLLLLLFATRGLLVLADADVFFYGDELAKGTVAKGLLQGVGAPSWKLDYVYHEGGGFLIAHVKALAFALIGPSVLAHKVVAILTTSILLAVGFWTASEHFGRNAGAIFGLLFVLCPTSFLRYSLISIGTHYEAVIFAVLILHYATRIALAERESRRDWALLGFFAGLGIYFSLQTAPAIAAAGIFLLVRLRRRAFGPGLATAVLGFAVGAAPLWLMMSHVGTRALVVQAHTNFSAGLRGWDAVREWFLPLFRGSHVGAWVAAIALPIVVAWALGAGAGADRLLFRARCTPILLYLALFVLLYAQSGFALSHDQIGHLFWLRSSSLWFFTTMLLSACAARLLERGAPAAREIALGVVALLVVAGLGSFAGLLAAGRPGSLGENAHLLTKTKGYDLTDFFDKYVDHFEGSLPERLARLEAFEDEPDLLLPAATHSLLERSGLSLDAALAFTRENFGERWSTAALGLGLEVAPDYGRDLRSAFASIRKQAPDAQPALAEALGRVALGLKLAPEKIDEAARVEAPADLRAPFLRGVGWRIHRMYRLRPDLAAALIDRQPEDAQASLSEGERRARAANSLK
jgi:hypothetical protein